MTTPLQALLLRPMARWGAVALLFAASVGCAGSNTTGPESVSPSSDGPSGSAVGSGGSTSSTAPESKNAPGQSNQDAPRNAEGSPEVPPPSPREVRGLKRLRVLKRGDKMPEFELQAEGGERLDSAAFLGQRPFVVVFFTSWCRVCERKMPILRQALESFGQGVAGIGIGMDQEETWQDVPPYVERHQLPVQLVRGSSAPELVSAINPGGSFPVLYVVGRDGRVVDVQIGLKPDHSRRLELALKAARQAN